MLACMHTYTRKTENIKMKGSGGGGARGGLDHHRRRLEDGVGDLSNAELLVVGLLRRDDRGVRSKHKVDA